MFMCFEEGIEQVQGLPLRGFGGTGGSGLAKLFRMGTCPSVDTRPARDVVGQGALRGRSPCTREGRIGPTAQMQRSVDREGASCVRIQLTSNTMKGASLTRTRGVAR